MKKIIYILILLIISCQISTLFTSCVEVDDFNDTPRDNFEALWKIMDEKYCFFTSKEVDWNQVHDKYSLRINDNMRTDSLFTVLNEMLQELKDGHVNLYSSWDIGRYWKWFEDYPKNFDADLIDDYLGTDYRYVSGMKYKILEDSIGYISYRDFSSGISIASLDYILFSFVKCKGIIIDVRNNGGGTLSNVTEFVSRFANEKTLVGYIQHKTGKGHDDFSEPYPKYIEPSERIRYLGPTIVLTNRQCYSATNEFVSNMRIFPQVIIMGDVTGGGGGLPFSSELPNGWSVRFSACPNLDNNKQQIEFGIEPDISVRLLKSDVDKGEDTLIETAKKTIKKIYN